MKKTGQRLITGGVLALLLAGGAEVAFASGKKPVVPAVPTSTTDKQPLVRADVSKIKDEEDPKSGNWVTNLHEGIYEMGLDLDKTVEYYLLVQKYTNDPSSILAIMFHANALRDDFYNYTSAWIYQGRAIGDGPNNRIMLAPIDISREGNPEVVSETNSEAPVILLSRTPGRFWSYKASPRNGAHDGKLFGLRRSTKWPKPAIFSKTTDGTFISAHSLKKELSVESAGAGKFEFVFNDGNKQNSVFESIDENGPGGHFLGLTSNQFNATAEASASGERISKWAVFIHNCFDSDRVLVAEPKAIGEGAYDIKIYRKTPKDILDKIAEGRE